MKVAEGHPNEDQRPPAQPFRHIHPPQPPSVPPLQHYSIHIDPLSPKTPPPLPPPTNRSAPKWPSPIFLSDKQRENYVNICLPLYNAALKGDWGDAKEIIDNCDRLVINVSITKYHETALHVASSTNHTHFVKKLVELMKKEDMELQNELHNTALCVAATAGNFEIAKTLLTKNSKLLFIRGQDYLSPLYMAAFSGHRDMVIYFYQRTDHLRGPDWTNDDRIGILRACVSAKIYDVALMILKHHKEEVAVAREMNALHVLARQPSEFDETKQTFIWRLIDTLLPRFRVGTVHTKCQALQIVEIIMKEIVKLKDADILAIVKGPSDKNKVEESKDSAARLRGTITESSSELQFVAAEVGNTRFLIELLRYCPELMWNKYRDEKTIFHIAILHRKDSIYNLLYENKSSKNILGAFTDTNDNNILHIAAMKPEQNELNKISGAALQMQRELQWFKEVETMVHHTLREMKNKQGKTPQALFTEEHAELLKSGEKWMKETSAQCMVVATLIATIMFAAAFTLPGGNNSSNGNPIFLSISAFIVFVITDAVSLFTASASILMFLAILTARFAENDFWVSLPLKLMVGLAMLFISITTMMIAFSASFFLVYTRGMKWVPILISILAGGPVILFVALQFGLFIDVIRSTLSSRFLFKPKKM